MALLGIGRQPEGGPRGPRRLPGDRRIGSRPARRIPRRAGRVFQPARAERGKPVNRAGDDGMSRLRDLLVLIFVACAVSGTSLVLGQVQQGQATFTITIAPVQPQVVKKEAPRAEPNPKDGVAKKEAVGKAAAPKQAAGKVAVPMQAIRKAAVLRQAVAVPVPLARCPGRSGRAVRRAIPADVQGGVLLHRQLLRPDQGPAQASGPPGRHAVKAAARKFVEAQQNMMRGGWRPGTEYPDPRKLLEEELARSVDQHSDASSRSATAGTARNGPPVAGKCSSTTWSRSSTGPGAHPAAAQRSWPRRCEPTGMNPGGSPWRCSRTINNFLPSIPDQVVAPFLTDHQKASGGESPGIRAFSGGSASTGW